MFVRTLAAAFLTLAFVAGKTVHADGKNAPATQPEPSLAIPPNFAASQEPQIHGYMETQLKSAHITPRGLVVTDKGTEIQPAAGLIFDLYDGDGFFNKVTGTVGIWNSLSTTLHIPSAGPWFEIDYLAKVNFVIEKRWNVCVEYLAFDSPGREFQTDNNIETTVSYDDTGYLSEGFGLHPYVRMFYNASGGSTTALGRNGNTYDVELGFVPTYHWKAIADYPITFTLPTYITVGPANFWGGNQNVGVATTSLAASMPLSFIPRRFGIWHIDASVAYFNLLNGKLADAAAILGNGRDRNRVVGEFGIGMDF